MLCLPILLTQDCSTETRYMIQLQYLCCSCTRKQENSLWIPHATLNSQSFLAHHHPMIPDHLCSMPLTGMWRPQMEPSLSSNLEMCYFKITQRTLQQTHHQNISRELLGMSHANRWLCNSHGHHRLMTQIHSEILQMRTPNTIGITRKSVLQTLWNTVKGKLATIVISLRALSMGSKRQFQTMSNAFGSEVCWWVVHTGVQHVGETVTIVVESQKSLLQTILNTVEGKLATIAVSLRALSMGFKRQDQTMSNAFKVKFVDVLWTLEFNVYWKLLQFMLTLFSVLKANLVSWWIIFSFIPQTFCC